MTDAARAAPAASHLTYRKLALALASCAIVLIVVVLISNAYLTGGSAIVPLKDPWQVHDLDKVSAYLGASLASVDQSVSMLTTVQVSLFVLAGIGLGKAIGGGRKPPTAQILVGCAFILFAFVSLTLGYAARMQMATLIGSVATDFTSVRRTVVHQAMFVTFSAISAICMLVVALLEGQSERQRRA